MEKKHVDENEFEGKIKISNFPSKESIIEKIDSFLSSYKKDENEKIYDIEKETPNYIILNFQKNTDIANYINRNLRLLQMEDPNYSKLKFNMITKVITKNQKEEKEKEKGEKDQLKKKIRKKMKLQEIESSIYDAKNNPKINKLLSNSLHFTRKNINQYMNQENNKMKIYESIFLGGQFKEKHEIEHEERIKNKAKWISQKVFNPYISKQTIDKNRHILPNYLSLEPEQSNNVYNFRKVDKSKWVGKHNFFAGDINK